MTTIPQRELRNNVGEILRRAEHGERFTVTVSGRPVAELGPSRAARPASAEDLRSIHALAAADPTWSQQLAEMRREDWEAAEDPWTS